MGQFLNVMMIISPLWAIGFILRAILQELKKLNDKL